MTLATLPRKLGLALLLACGSVLWLNAWHQYGFSRSPINFPPVSNWWRDSLTLLLPILLGIWCGVGATRRLSRLLAGRLSASTHTLLASAVLAFFATLMTILVEGSRVIQTGIGNEFIFLASICGRLYPRGNLTLNAMQWLFPGTRALRYHTLLQDGLNLILVNLALTILALILLEGLGALRLPTRQGATKSAALP